MGINQKRYHVSGKLALGLLVCAVASSALAGPTEAQEYIETVTVVGTKTEREIGEVAGALTIISEDEIDRRMMRDIADLISTNPVFRLRVLVSDGAFRLSIRGIGGNRVLTLVDGVQVPEAFSFGPFLNARRDFVAIESMANIEIAKGSGSSLYGSDAVGGVVAIKTRRPQDYVDSDNPWYVGYKGGYSSEDQGLVNTLSVAGRLSGINGLIEYADTRASEPKLKVLLVIPPARDRKLILQISKTLIFVLLSGSTCSIWLMSRRIMKIFPVKQTRTCFLIPELWFTALS